MIRNSMHYFFFVTPTRHGYAEYGETVAPILFAK